MFTPTDFLSTPEQVADAIVAILLRRASPLSGDARRLERLTAALGLTADDVAACSAEIRQDDDKGAKTRDRLLARFSQANR